MNAAELEERLAELEERLDKLADRVIQMDAIVTTKLGALSAVMAGAYEAAGLPVPASLTEAFPTRPRRDQRLRLMRLSKCLAKCLANR